MSSPLRQVRISDQVMDYVVQLIAEGRLTPGDRLPSESELARRLGVSRPAVREATNALAGRGVIAVSTGRNPTVRPLHERPFAGLVAHALATRQVGAIEVLQVRRGLEELSAELAALNHSDDDARALGDLACRFRDAAGDAERFLEIDVAFHRALSRAAGNPLLSAMLAGLADAARDSTRAGLGVARIGPEWDEILRLHLELAEAVVAASPAEARRIMGAHFESAMARLRRAFPEE